MYLGKPIIGIAGGIGSGKSLVAGYFQEMGCYVIDSDSQVRAAYRDPEVRETLREWWGEGVVLAGGDVNRELIARTIFNDPAQRRRLEQLLHPRVNEAREREMAQAAANALPVAFVWDTPLLFEAGLAGECDYIVFVDSSADERLRRVQQARGWDRDEWRRRENLQWPLDKKREVSHYVLSNTADAAQTRDQVRELLPKILAHVANRSV